MREIVNIKYFMVVYVGLLLGLASFYLGEASYFYKGLAVALIYIALDLLWTFIRDKTWYIPSSSVISGFILAVVGAPAPDLYLLILLPLVAVISKQLIKLGRPRHIFNPASFSMILLSVLGYQAVSWWGVAWGAPVLYAVLVAGLFILWRQNRWDTAVSFLAAYAVFLGAFLLLQGRSADQLFFLLRPQILDGTTLFFASVMLVEPMTSSFPGTKNRIVYGVLVALFAVLVTALGRWVPLDPLLSGVLLGNLIMSLKTT